jgi:hypothetical protein
LVAAGSKLGPEHLAVAAAAAAVGWLFYTATRAAGPFPPVDRAGPLTELEAPAQNFVTHLARAGELLAAPVKVPHRYPDQTCPGITVTMHQGFVPFYRLPDPQLAALPAEQAW